MTEASDGTPPQSPDVLLDPEVEIGGTLYRLKFSVLAMMALKDRWLIQDDDAVLRRAIKGNVTDIPALFHALTRTHNPELSYSQAMKLLDAAGIDATYGYGRPMAHAIGIGLPKPSKGKKKPQGKPSA